MTKRMNAINQICTLVDSLSASDKKIADYILAHPEDVERQTVRELAQSTHTSAATVSRFARNLGYKSFSELRIAVALTNGDKATATKPGVALGKGTFEESKQYILNHKIVELEETAGFIDEETFNRFYSCCKNAVCVLIVGAGNTVTMAQNAAFKFNQAGIRAVAPPSADAAVVASINLDEDDVLLVLSTSGLSKHLQICMEHAEDNGATILMITDNPKSPLGRRAKYVLRTATRDFILTTNSAFSHNSMNFVIELLFLHFLSSWNNAVEWSRMLEKSMSEDRRFLFEIPLDD